MDTLLSLRWQTILTIWVMIIALALVMGLAAQAFHYAQPGASS